MVITKSLFSPSVFLWRKTRKRKPWILSFIEEAWICRTGAIFQRFSVKWRQARNDREVRVTLERRSGKKKKHLCPAEQAHLLRFSYKHTQVGSENEEWVTHGRSSTKKERQNQLYSACTPIVPASFFPNTRGDHNEHGFMSRQHFLQRNDSYK